MLVCAYGIDASDCKYDKLIIIIGQIAHYGIDAWDRNAMKLGSGHNIIIWNDMVVQNDIFFNCECYGNGTINIM